VRHVQRAADRLLAAARYHFSLFVMGGYGHSAWIFGGFTQQVVRDAEILVLIVY